MASRFQAASLVASPSYPNAIAWSDENLVAVASGHIVTILNPAMPFGPRALITVPSSEPFPVGVIERENLLSGCLLPTCLSRDVRPCVRSISWSPTGLASNAGCLLAVCTTEGRVKVYRSPFCEFSAEWTEVMDVSEMLHTYFDNISFRELDVPSSSFSDGQASELGRQHTCNDDQTIVSLPKSRGRRPKKVLEKCSLPLISAEHYASRIAMLSSLVVAWSPILRVMPECGLVPPNNSSNGCALLALGAKSGRISFWRIHEPQSYSIIRSVGPTASVLTGLLQAHNAWITAISWAELPSDSSNPQLLLATGSSDGSVKIWRVYRSELLNSIEDSQASFSLLKEVIDIDYVPVSVLSLLVPVQSPHKIILAVGKGSGALEVWICDIVTNKVDKHGLHNAHDHIVTGLAWAFDGSCLYSCGQDNSLRSWMLSGNSLYEVSLPPNILGVKSSTDVPNAFESCFGLAVSPANLVVAVARNFDPDRLNPMYQARSQKAAVEFFWIGGQKPETFSSTDPDFGVEEFPGFLDVNLVHWGYNILRSLNQYDHLNLDKPLVVWDIVAALLAFKQCVPDYAEHILLKWLNSHLGSECGSSPENILPHASQLLSNLTSRQLHLLTIIIRRVLLAEVKSDSINSENQKVVVEEEQPRLWTELLDIGEKELRERLIGSSFSAVINCLSHSTTDMCKPGYWQPVGLAQMEQWIAMNDGHVKNHLKFLASEIGKIENSRIHSICKYVAEEQCSYCSEPVPFEQTEVAFCQGVKCGSGVSQKHKLARCAVTMQVCPATPSWFCICCRRWVSNLAPQSHFMLQKYPASINTETHSSTIEVWSKPFCPFCGILLQRLQPDFLLSVSPV